jgi:hypothetical protein
MCGESAGDDNIRCHMCDIRRRMLTYDIVHGVQCRTCDVVCLYPVYRTYDIARTMYNTMSYFCTCDIVRRARTTSYRRWQESRCRVRRQSSRRSQLDLRLRFQVCRSDSRLARAAATAPAGPGRVSLNLTSTRNMIKHWNSGWHTGRLGLQLEKRMHTSHSKVINEVASPSLAQ